MFQKTNRITAVLARSQCGRTQSISGSRAARATGSGATLGRVIAVQWQVDGCYANFLLDEARVNQLMGPYAEEFKQRCHAAGWVVPAEGPSSSARQPWAYYVWLFPRRSDVPPGGYGSTLQWLGPAPVASMGQSGTLRVVFPARLASSSSSGFVSV